MEITNQITEEFRDALLGFIRKRVQNVEDAEDILQEVFYKLLNQSSTQVSNINGWMYQVSRNAIVDYYRKKKIPTQEIEGIQISHEQPTEEDQIDLSNCAKPIINSLPEKYKEALIKTTFEKVSQKDLANQLGLSHSAIKSRVQRGRDMVKAAIIDCCNPITDKYGNIIEKEKCKNECGCD